MGSQNATADGEKAVSYSNGFDNHVPRATLTVHEEAKEAKVTYPARDGGRPFRVIVRQKPNPIGFHVRLPGDRV